MVFFLLFLQCKVNKYIKPICGLALDFSVENGNGSVSSQFLLFWVSFGLLKNLVFIAASGFRNLHWNWVLSSGYCENHGVVEDKKGSFFLSFSSSFFVAVSGFRNLHWNWVLSSGYCGDHGVVEDKKGFSLSFNGERRRLSLSAALESLFWS